MGRTGLTPKELVTAAGLAKRGLKALDSGESFLWTCALGSSVSMDNPESHKSECDRIQAEMSVVVEETMRRARDALVVPSGAASLATVMRPALIVIARACVTLLEAADRRDGLKHG